jgi:hypothetical protein
MTAGIATFWENTQSTSVGNELRFCIATAFRVNVQRVKVMEDELSFCTPPAPPDPSLFTKVQSVADPDEWSL